jgi:hypothetical protein
MDKFPNINRVDGDVPLDKVEDRILENQKLARKDFYGAEITPTAVESQIIDDVSIGLEVMFKNVYHVDFKPILKERIHIVKEGTLRDKHGRGMHQSPSGDIYLEPLAVHGSKIVFAKVLAHELVHYLSFNTVQATEKSGEIRVRPHVGGLGILKYEEHGVRDYFDILDEAATSYLSSEFLRMELNHVRKNLDKKQAYTDECMAVDIVRDWLHDLPDSVGVDKTEWDKDYIISIPFAEEMAVVIKSGMTEEEKLNVYVRKIFRLSPQEKSEFYLERVREIESVYQEISAMFSREETEPEKVKRKVIELIRQLAMLKLTGQGFRGIVRQVEKILGVGSFKKLAEKFSKFEEYNKKQN